MDHIKAKIDAKNARIAEKFKDASQYTEFDVYGLVEAMRAHRDEMITRGEATVRAFQATADAIRNNTKMADSYVTDLDVNELQECQKALKALYVLQNAGLKTIKLKVDGSPNFYEQIINISKGHSFVFELPADVKAKLGNVTPMPQPKASS